MPPRSHGMCNPKVRSATAVAALVVLAGALGACGSSSATGPVPTTTSTSNVATTQGATVAPVATPPGALDINAIMFPSGEDVAGLPAQTFKVFTANEVGATRAADLAARGFVTGARQLFALGGDNLILASVWIFEGADGAEAEFAASVAPSPDCVELPSAADALAVATDAPTAAWACPSYSAIGGLTAPAAAVVQVVVGTVVIRVTHNGPGSQNAAASIVLVEIATALLKRVGG